MLWHLKAFDQLSNHEVYKIMKLRVDIFVVEQKCPYGDLDDRDLDENALHLFAKEGDEISCYLRILPPGSGYPDMPSLGRVATQQKQRGTGIGHALVIRANQTLDELWPNTKCHLSAQSHLQGFYAQHGYKPVGEGFLEDGIPHIGMERSPANER